MRQGEQMYYALQKDAKLARDEAEQCRRHLDALKSQLEDYKQSYKDLAAKLRQKTNEKAQQDEKME